MRYYLGLMLVLVLFFSALFGLAMAWDLPLLTDPAPSMTAGAWWAGGIGVCLLVADVLIPVPASLVMIAHGTAFGVIGGSLLSLAGALGANLCGFWLGRRGSPLLARFFPEDARQRADQLVARHGVWAVIVTRPIPLLAETVAVVAGATAMRWRTLIGASFLGILPAAVLYAVTGATSRRPDDGFPIFGLVMGIAALAWLAGRYLPIFRAEDKEATAATPTPDEA